MSDKTATIREDFLKVTGLTYDIDDVISKLNDEDKEKFKKNIEWHIPGGAYLAEGSAKKELVDKFLNSLDEALGLSSDENGDDETPDDDKVIEDTISEGGDVTISEPTDISNIIELKTNLNLTVSANIKTEPAQDFIQISNNAEVKVNGNNESVIESPLGDKDTGSSVFLVEDGNLTLSNVNVIGARAVMTNNEKAEVTIESGEYNTFYAEAPSIYVGPKGGKIIIKDGTFGVSYNGTYYGGNKYLLNLHDSLLKNNSDKSATDFIEITGGKFIDYNPAESHSENPPVSFVAKGYKSVELPEKEGNLTVWEVVEDK